MPRIATGCRTSGGLHLVDSTRWAPPSGAHSGAPHDDGLHRGAHHSGAPPYPMRRTVRRCPALESAGAPHPMHRTALVRPQPTNPLSGCGRARIDPLVRLRYTPLSSSATATFLLDIAGFGL